MSQEEPMDGLVPIAVAAERAGYSYSMVQKMVKRGILASSDFFGRPLVNLQEVLDYRRRMHELGTAKHTPRRYRHKPEPIADSPAESTS